MTEGEGEVLVEEISEELAHSDVGPSSMNQQQSFQVAKLSHAEVTR